MVLTISQKVLFIGDFGIDDIVALLYAYYSEEVEIVGVVVDYGNISRENALVTATYIQNLTNLFEVPIISGADRPLTGEIPTYYPEIHGEYGLGPIIPKIKLPPTELENFYEILTIINRYKNELVVVNIGRLTSLATAVVLYPNILSTVKSIYMMGGAFLYPGNASPLAEANFYSDHYAANLVLKHARNTKIFPLNVTEYAILPETMIQELNTIFQKRNDPVGVLLEPIISYYSNWYKNRNPSIKGGPLHDLLTIWAVTNNNSFQFTEKPVKINTDNGECRGVSIGDFRPFKELANYPTHTIAISFDYEYFIKDIFRTFSSGRHLSNKES
ncbi:nucleoside hydrolase [Metabacillus litoralis]|uniref:nucleoside hydrolase n=1 Tax=Metabacillus litoralis TaxID=152268 RepID=UPI001F00BFD9|nr:nucleoside hydrolase [Metabacillus litoralis]